MFQLRDMPRTMASLPYFQSSADLKGLITTNGLPAGCQLPGRRRTCQQFRLADAAFEVLSIPVEPVSAVGGQIISASV